MDRVSIIVPVYNVAPYLPRCIESLLGQTHSNVEVILVDDCSKDDSKSVMQEYAQRDNRVCTIYQPKNKGVSAARNRALDLISGDWVCFCDGDDWYELDFVEKMLDCAKKENADYIMCNYKIVSEYRPEIVAGSIDGLSSGCDIKTVIACGPTSSCTHMIKKVLFDISCVRYPEECRQYEELPVIPVLAKYANKIGVVEEALYNYFQRGDGSSASNVAKDSEKNFFIAWKIMQEKLGNDYCVEAEYHAIYALFYGEILILCKRKESRKAIKEKILSYEMSFPQYYDNPYILHMGKAKKIFLWLVKNRIIIGVRLLSWMHSKIVS